MPPPRPPPRANGARNRASTKRALTGQMDKIAGVFEKSAQNKLQHADIPFAGKFTVTQAKRAGKVRWRAYGGTFAECRPCGFNPPAVQPLPISRAELYDSV